MPTKVPLSLLQNKVVVNAVVQGQDILVTFSDGTSHLISGVGGGGGGSIGNGTAVRYTFSATAGQTVFNTGNTLSSNIAVLVRGVELASDDYSYSGSTVTLIGLSELPAGTPVVVRDYGVPGTSTGNLTEAQADARYLRLIGGTLTGPLTLPGAPTANLHAATKQYVDSLLSGGPSGGLNVGPYSDTTSTFVNHAINGYPYKVKQNGATPKFLVMRAAYILFIGPGARAFLNNTLSLTGAINVGNSIFSHYMEVNDIMHHGYTDASFIVPPNQWIIIDGNVQVFEASLS